LFLPHLGCRCRKDPNECRGIIVGLGAGDAEVHWICPQQIDDAIASGLTTMYGGGCAPLGSALGGSKKNLDVEKDNFLKR
jgi:urease alpha subunit